MKRKTNNSIDSSTIETISYNEQSGAKKQMVVGPSLKPIFSAAPNTYTTDISTLTKIGKGQCVAIFNPTATIYSVTIGASTTTALAVGATDTNGNVGIALQTGWTYLSLGNNEFIKSNTSDVYCYIIVDDSFIV